MAPGTQEAAVAHVELLVERLRVVNRQIRRCHQRLDALCDAQTPESDGEESIPGEQSEERDVEILGSLVDRSISRRGRRASRVIGGGRRLPAADGGSGRPIRREVRGAETSDPGAAEIHTRTRAPLRRRGIRAGIRS